MMTMMDSLDIRARELPEFKSNRYNKFMFIYRRAKWPLNSVAFAHSTCVTWFVFFFFPVSFLIKLFPLALTETGLLSTNWQTKIQSTLLSNRQLELCPSHSFVFATIILIKWINTGHTFARGWKWTLFVFCFPSIRHWTNGMVNKVNKQRWMTKKIR